jgi:non-specific serine/threonine protein kinase
VLNDVTSLVEQSLLQQEDLGDGRAWYSMLETVREYALERLEESDEADSVRRRLVRYYLTLAEAAEDGLLGPRQTEWFAYLEREQDNMRAVLRWCRERGYAEPAFRIAVAMWWFWGVHGHVSEGRTILTDLLSRFPLQNAAEKHLALRAQALRAAGMLASIQGDHAAARTLHEEGLSLRRRLGDPAGIYNALEGLGMITGLQGDTAAARGFLEDALAIARTLDEPQYTATALHNLGSLMHTQGDHIAARAILEDCVALRRTLEDPECLAVELLSLAGVTHDLGDDALTRQLTQESLALYHTAGNRRKEALALVHIGDIALSQRDYVTARSVLCESLLLQQELGDPAGIAFVLDRFVALAAAQHAPALAVRLAGATATLREAIGVPSSPAARDGIDNALMSARRALGASAAHAAEETGRALPLETAIAEAMAPTTPDVELPMARTTQLTRRERGVAALIAAGYSNRQIAAELFITEGTVANHVVHILNKLGYTSRAQIAVWATRHDLVATEAT